MVYLLRYLMEVPVGTWVEMSKTPVRHSAALGGPLIGDKPRAGSLSFQVNTCLPFPSRAIPGSRILLFYCEGSVNSSCIFLSWEVSQPFNHPRSYTYLRRALEKCNDRWRKLSRSLPGQRRPPQQRGRRRLPLRARLLLTPSIVLAHS